MDGGRDGERTADVMKNEGIEVSQRFFAPKTRRSGGKKPASGSFLAGRNWGDTARDRCTTPRGRGSFIAGCSAFFYTFPTVTIKSFRTLPGRGKDTPLSSLDTRDKRSF